MNSVKHWEAGAPAVIKLSLACIAGIWALISLPSPGLIDRAMLANTTTETANADPVYVYRNPNAYLAQLPKHIELASYPTPNWVAMQELFIDPALVFAIIRQESRFKTNARSPAGARGAMQLMPKTAQYMIKRFKLNELQVASAGNTSMPRSITTQDLNDPAINLMIGQHYIKYLSEKSYIDGNLVYLLAAYNAGPGNLIKWQKRFGHLPPQQFAERIPFKETRDYVRKVMANYRIYQTKLYGYAYNGSAG